VNPSRTLHSRRQWLKTSASFATLAALRGAPLLGALASTQAHALDWNAKAFDARNLKDALRLWGISAAQESKDIVFPSAWDTAENGAVVPLEVRSNIPNTESIVLFADKNPQPLIASFDFLNGTESYVSTRVKLGETTLVRAYARAAGKYYLATKQIKVTIGGCGEYEVGAPPSGKPSGEPMRTRTVLRSDVAEIKVLMSHPMETGRRKDGKGALIPAYHIRNVTVSLNALPVLQAQWGTPVSRNPYLAVRVRGAKAGDKVVIAWVDTAGEQARVETSVDAPKT
jgi:sulfur-oxidizing protein SoxY